LVLDKETERKCIVTGEVKEASSLLRFTVMDDGTVAPDFKKRLPGKGVYVTNSKKVLKTAVAKNLFSKVLKKNVKTSDDLICFVEDILRKKGLESINLARKAGALITGFEKVVEAVKKEKAAFLLEASDAGPDGVKKIALIAKGVEIFRLYTTEELDKATDKINTVHTAFIKSEIAKMVYNDFKRFQAFEADNTEIGK
jgi:hypothetical protein